MKKIYNKNQNENKLIEKVEEAKRSPEIWNGKKRNKIILERFNWT